jgi:hypothetical protein
MHIQGRAAAAGPQNMKKDIGDIIATLIKKNQIFLIYKEFQNGKQLQSHI